MTSALVEDGVRRWGLLGERPTYVNPLDEYLGATRRTRRLRLKEWLGWTLVHPELSSSMILQDAHYLASSELYVRDAASGRLTQHARNARGGSLRLPEMLDGSRPAIEAKGYRIAYSFGEASGTHTVSAEIAGTDTELPVRLHLTLDGSRASAPLSVSQPLGGRSAIYTHKRIYPVAGEMSVGDHTYVFEPGRDLAILDEHKSLLPYRTRWVWGTFATVASDGIVGANLGERDAEPGSQGESCAWLPGLDGPVCVGLDAPRFVPVSGDPMSAWRVATADGRVELEFRPEGRKDVKHQLVVFGIDYSSSTEPGPARWPGGP